VISVSQQLSNIDKLGVKTARMNSSLLGSSTGELLVVFGAVFLTTYYVMSYRRRQNGSSHKLPPTLPSLPIVGSLPFLPHKLEDLAEFCTSSRNKLGKIFSFRVGSKYNVLFVCYCHILRVTLIRSTQSSTLRRTGNEC